ncbi:MAG: hypothetical protein WA290_11295 [Mycobacterium sp.]
MRAQAREKIMLIVEFNVAGYRFSAEMPDLRRKPLRSARFNPRTIQWRIPQLRSPKAA